MDTIQQQGQFFLYLLITLGICIFAIQIYAISFYVKERDVITKYRKHLDENPDAELEESLATRQVSKDSPLRKRIEIIKDAVRHKRPAAVSEFAALSDEHDHTYKFNSIPATFIGLFLIFGLGGTMYLLNTLLDSSDMSSIVQASGDLSTIKLREAVGKLYGGFGHAFVASLAGIGVTCGLVFIRGIWVNPIRSQFYHDLDSLTVTELLPRLQPRDIALPNALVNTSDSMKHVADQMRAMVEIVQLASDSNKATSEIAQNAVTELASFADAMKSAAKALDNSVRRLDKTFGDDGEWAKRNVALDLGLSDLSAKIGEQNGINTALSESAMNLKQLISGLIEIITPILPEIHDFLAKHPDRILKIEKQLYGIDGNLNAVDARLDASIGTKIVTLAAAVSSLQKIISPISKDQLMPLGNQIQSLDGNMQSLNGSLQNGLPLINNRLESSVKDIAAVLGLLKTIDARLGPLQSSVEELVLPFKANVKVFEGTSQSSAVPGNELSANAALRKKQELLTTEINSLRSNEIELKQDIRKLQNKFAEIINIENPTVKPKETDELLGKSSRADATNQHTSKIAPHPDGKKQPIYKHTETIAHSLEEVGAEKKGGFFHKIFRKL
jgi:hypothetical protein